MFEFEEYGRIDYCRRRIANFDYFFFWIFVLSQKELTIK